MIYEQTLWNLPFPVHKYPLKGLLAKAGVGDGPKIPSMETMPEVMAPVWEILFRMLIAQLSCPTGNG